MQMPLRTHEQENRCATFPVPLRFLNEHSRPKPPHVTVTSTKRLLKRKEKENALRNGVPREVYRKTQFRTVHCKYFFRGMCKYGQDCEFLHAPLSASDQLVTVTQIPRGIDGKTLAKLFKERLGFEVLNHCQIIDGVCEKLVLGKIEQVNALLTQKTVQLGDFSVIVKKYKDSRSQLSLRSVFVGGLPKNITESGLKFELQRLAGVTVTSMHRIKHNSFCPKVILQSEQQANQLIRMKILQIGASEVDIRPFMEPRNMCNPTMFL